MNIWFTSDTHFGHAKISEYSNRPFKTVEEMDEALISNWNALVKKGDTVYHLGDFSFARETEDVEAYIKRLYGQIHLIRGNHDHRQTRKAKFAEVLDYKELNVNGQVIVLCHYPIASWNKMHHGSWMLHGHSHGSFPEDLNARRIDVGVDPRGYKPISFDDVERIMRLYSFKPVDHHGRREGMDE